VVATCIAIWGSRLLALVTSKVEARFAAKNQATFETIQGFNAAEPMMSVPAPIDQNIPGPPKKE
jgi:hypothetical protein